MTGSESSPQDNNLDIPLEKLIKALLDQSIPLSPKFLYRFSDLSGTELTQLKAVWPHIENQRRKGLLEDLELLMESNYLVSFESVFRIGFSDKDASIRQISIRALWGSEDSSLISEFLYLLENDEAYPVQAQAATSLGHFVYLGEIGRIHDEKLKMIVDKLIEVLEKNTSPLIGQYALESLGYSSHSKVPSLIEDAYDTNDEDWRTSALVAMGRSANEQWYPFVVNNLDHSNIKVRLAATQAAGKLAIPEALPILFELLSDENDEVQMAAVWALSEIGGDDARETLENLLDNTENEETLEIIEDALDNLSFNEDLQDFNIMDVSQDDLEDMTNIIKDEE